MHVFYLPGNDLKGELELPEGESHHAIKVLRLKTGDPVIITDGSGGIYRAQISKISSRSAGILIETVLPVPERSYSVHIAVAPVKNADRLEFMIEKLVELGIDKITFIVTDRSERRKLNTERLEKIAVSAMKQSVKGWVSIIEGPVPFEKFLTSSPGKQKFIAHQEMSEGSHLSKTTGEAKDYLVLIGPEGDFTGEELNMAIKAGYIPVSLGNYRLRTETAAINACSILNVLNFKPAKL